MYSVHSHSFHPSENNSTMIGDHRSRGSSIAKMVAGVAIGIFTWIGASALEFEFPFIAVVLRLTSIAAFALSIIRASQHMRGVRHTHYSLYSNTSPPVNIYSQTHHSNPLDFYNLRSSSQPNPFLYPTQSVQGVFTNPLAHQPSAPPSQAFRNLRPTSQPSSISSNSNFARQVSSTNAPPPSQFHSLAVTHESNRGVNSSSSDIKTNRRHD